MTDDTDRNYSCPICGLEGSAPVGTRIGCAGAYVWDTAHEPVDFIVTATGTEVISEDVAEAMRARERECVDLARQLEERGSR